MSNLASLDDLQKILSEDLKVFRASYRDTLASGISTIDRIVGYLTRSHGKGIRPMLTLLCGRLGGNPLSSQTVRGAVIVELLHEATLIHDDVVDDAAERRGLPSLRAKFKNKISVLFGDYMLAKVLSETLEARDFKWLDILSETARRMAKGELIQAVHAKRLDMTEDKYLQMIADKTGALFSACSRIGGLSGGLSENFDPNLTEYGETLGIAFQIKDDLLDLFGDGGLLGKPTGGDLKDRKLTLPLLGALNRVSPRESRRIRARIRRGVKRGEINFIRDFVRTHEGDKYSEQIINEMSSKAVKAIYELPPSKYREYLNELITFAVRRGK